MVIQSTKTKASGAKSDGLFPSDSHHYATARPGTGRRSRSGATNPLNSEPATARAARDGLGAGGVRRRVDAGGARPAALFVAGLLAGLAGPGFGVLLPLWLLLGLGYTAVQTPAGPPAAPLRPSGGPAGAVRGPVRAQPRLLADRISSRGLAGREGRPRRQLSPCSPPWRRVRRSCRHGYGRQPIRSDWRMFTATCGPTTRIWPRPRPCQAAIATSIPSSSTAPTRIGPRHSANAVCGRRRHPRPPPIGASLINGRILLRPHQRNADAPMAWFVTAVHRTRPGNDTRQAGRGNPGALHCDGPTLIDHPGGRAASTCGFGDRANLQSAVPP